MGLGDGVGTVRFPKGYFESGLDGIEIHGRGLYRNDHGTVGKAL